MLSAGSKIGAYEITGAIGAGGMGEVYRARDTILGRDVAIKVLPEAFARDAERMARFEREAKVLASLNHPNIASIYGVEISDNSRALIMELVEGPTLAERIAAGPIPVDEALRIARQMADALEYAHEHSVVHRDLKPANIKISREDVVKILDFGLAKAIEGDAWSMDIGNSPTLTHMATQAGVLLGTASYMSPEQAKAKPVDRRADIWAFGCVLYEMLTGKMAFHGETISDTLAAIIRAEPDWTLLPKDTSARVRMLLQRCLEKDAKQRLQAIGEARITLDEVLSGAPEPTSSAVTAAAATPVPVWRRGLPWAVAAGCLAIALIALGFGGFKYFHRAPSAPPIRLSAEIGVDASLFTGLGPAAVLSPDGTRMALLATGADQKRRIYVRSLDQLRATALSDTEDAGYPFFSPDGQWIGFFADGKLKKISVQGGAAIVLCDAPNGRGGSWGDDGAIVFAPIIAGALSKVSSAGGTPQPLTTLDRQMGEVTEHWPQVLPGSKAVLFTSNTNTGSYENADIVVYSMASNQRKTVVRGGFYGRYLPSGQLVYMHEGTLFAAPFDLKKLEVTGPPAPVVEGVLTVSGSGGPQFSFSNTGTLVYTAEGAQESQNVSIDWLDRDGKFTPLRETPGDYYNPAFSPDGKRLALVIQDGEKSDIWVYDLARGTLTRLTFGGGAHSPVWSPDGERIVYMSSEEKGGGYSLWWIRADGAGNPERLTKRTGELQWAGSWRPDGRFLAFSQLTVNSVIETMVLPFEGNEKSGWKPGEPKPFVNAGAMPAFSPDGHWLAYASVESGTSEVYVRPYPGPGGRWQISNGSGFAPRWSADGKELFYLTKGSDNADQKIMVVTYSASGGAFDASSPQPWSPVQFDGRFSIFNIPFDLAPDGKRFAVLKTTGTEQTSAPNNKVIFIFNFFDQVRRTLSPDRN